MGISGFLIANGNADVLKTAWVSSDSGSTFTLIHTFANTSTVEVFPFIHQNTNGTGTTTFGTIIASQNAIAV